MLGDSAYGTGEFRAELAERGHVDRGQTRPDRSAVPGGFTVDDFTVDHDGPHRDLPERTDPHDQPHRSVTFGAACAGCPLRARCTARATGRT